MAFDTTPPRNDYIGTGTVAVYDFGFEIYNETDLRVTIADTDGNEVTLMWPTDFTLPAGDVNNPNGGTITLVAGNLPQDYKLSIRFDRIPQQGTDLRNQGSYLSEIHEQKFDELTRYVQALRDVLDRTLHLPETEPGTPDLTTLPADRALYFLAFDASGSPIAAAGTSANLGPVSAFIDTLLDDTTAAAARATLGVSAFIDTLLDDADAAAARATLGVSAFIDTLLDDADADTARATLGLTDISAIINGDMEIWQRGTAIVAAVEDVYCADHWQTRQFATAGRWTINRSADVPTVAQAGVRFNYSLEIDVTTADTTVGATEISYIAQDIEGYNWRHFSHRPIVLSFWVQSAKTGIHCVAFQNQNNTYVAEYTVSLANTWEYKTIAVPASPSAGTWNFTHLRGVRILWALAVGSANHGAAGSWLSEFPRATSNQVNVLDSAANFFRLTGAQLQLGSVATPSQFRAFHDELMRSKRRYQKSFLIGTTPAQNAGNGGAQQSIAGKAGATSQLIHVRFPVEMRDTPIITLFNPGAANAQMRDLTAAVDCSSTSAVDITAKGFSITATGHASTAVGNRLAIHWTAAAEQP